MKTKIVDKINNIDFLNENCNFKEITKYFNHMSSSTRNYIKIEKDNTSSKYISIFSWISSDKWKIDCPIEFNKVHKQRYATKQESLQLLEKIYQNHDIESLKGFIDVPIRHFTLDDMLQFKKEDDMMLKGQDPNTDTIKKEKVTAKPKTVIAPKPKKEKAIPKTAIEMGKKLNIKTPKAENIVKNTTEKIIKNKLKDDGSFFQI